MTKSQLDSKLYAFFDAKQSADSHRRMAADLDAKATPIWDEIHDALFEAMKEGEALTHFKGVILRPIGARHLQVVTSTDSYEIAKRMTKVDDDRIDVEFMESTAEPLKPEVAHAAEALSEMF